MKHGGALFGNILHYFLIFLLIYNRKKKLMKIKEMLKYQCGYILSNCTHLVKNIGIQYLKTNIEYQYLKQILSTNKYK